MFFNRKKNKPKEKISLIKNNNDLLEELKEKGINDKNILNAIKKVPRKSFVNEISIQWAYHNMALPIDCEQTISQPYVVAYMIDCLKIKKWFEKEQDFFVKIELSTDTKEIKETERENRRTAGGGP